MRSFLIAIAAACMAACSSPPVIYRPSDLPGAPPTGSIRPLRELLPSDGTPVRLIFVHGVGDHCPGYALDPDAGWLSTKVTTAIGLTPLPGTTVPAHFINVNIFMGGTADARSGVRIAEQAFSMAIPGTDNKVRVEAIEITWSPLTQWLKSNQLGYDSPSTTPAAGAQTECTEPADPDIPATTQAPPRLLIDRTIKELIFDRNLSDAILYSGTYGKTMERGLAEALCHAVTGVADNVKCSWPLATQRDKKNYKYVFVTHSLGSRMTYDVLLDLLGYATDAKANPFTEDERKNAQPFIARLLADTPAVYMMANQLALLGLANVPPGARSNTGIHPYAFPELGLASMLPDDLVNKRSTSAPASVFGDVISSIAVAKLLGEKSDTRPSTSLQIVAFNDTNDLLTWHAPSWYTNAEVKASDGRPIVDVTNVFVQNTPKLLIIENPAPAHGNYFKKQAVWDVIACGASGGAVSKCP